MSGDFSRLSFDARRPYAGVLLQQGRVSLDADFNEEAALRLHLARSAVADLVGPYGGQAGAFALSAEPGRPFDFRIGAGRYYVDGWLAQNDAARPYSGQGLGPPPSQGRWLAWLEIWDRVVTAAEVDAFLPAADPRRLADPALGGGETAARLETVWAVRLAAAATEGQVAWATLAPTLAPADRGRLAIHGDYAGAENRLYRIQVHGAGGKTGGASFVWSRQNASAVFPVTAIDGKILTLATAPSDPPELRAGAWATLESPAGLGASPPPLVQLAGGRMADGRVALRSAPSAGVVAPALLRPWDHTASPRFGRLSGQAVTLTEDRAIPLEDGLSLVFSRPRSSVWRTGDYWLAAARPSVGAVLWPRDGAQPAAVAPHGVERRAAPLAVVRFDANGGFILEADLRRTIRPLAGA